MRTSGILLALALVLTPGLARAQRPDRGTTQAITGIVVEDSTHTPIGGALVSAIPAAGGAAKVIQTDSVGRFRLVLDTVGRFRLRVSHPSYRTVDSDTLNVDEDEVVTVELRLARQAIPLEPLVVTARVDRRISAFYDRVRRNGFGHFLTRQDIERRSGQRPTDLIRQLPGVRIVPTPMCRGCIDEDVVYLRGGGVSNRCSPTVFIDGMAVKQDTLSPLNSMVLTEDLEGVEVYTDVSAVPADFGAVFNSCGVVAFWTRTPEGKFSWKKMAAGVGLALIMVLIIVR